MVYLSFYHIPTMYVHMMYVSGNAVPKKGKVEFMTCTGPSCTYLGTI